jgi:DNA-binding NarL/FixJ family response regulator
MAIYIDSARCGRFLQYPVRHYLHMALPDPRPATIRVILVDDHALVREGVRQILEREPDFVVPGETGRAEEAVELVEQLAPDLVLLDVHLPGMSGIELTRRIRQAHLKVRVAVLSADADFCLEALRAGASGYFLKTARSRELVAGLRSISCGSTVFQGDLAASLGIWGPSARSQVAGLLSPRETEILRLIARGLTNRAIAREAGVAPRTADQHVHNILIKVGARSRAEAVRYAVEHELTAPA